MMIPFRAARRARKIERGTAPGRRSPTQNLLAVAGPNDLTDEGSAS